LILDARRGRLLLGRVMRRLVVGERRRAGIGEAACAVEAGEVGGGRTLERHDPTVRAGDEKKEDGELGRQQHGAEDQHAAAIERAARPQGREPIRPARRGFGGCIHAVSDTGGR
jgi:hypothetical protein